MRMRLPALTLSLGIAVIAAALAPACDRPNPLFRGPDAGAVGQAGVTGGAGTTGEAGTTGVAGTTGAAGTAAAACDDASDCTTARGAAPCGAWTCRDGACAVAGCTNCVDQDADGYGTGAGCGGPDCDDASPAIGATSERACYEGPAGTANVGTCRGGTQRCAAGVWASCAGQVVPSGEACNGLDDDCNGKPDDALGTIGCGLGECAKTAAACAAGVAGVCQPGGPTATVDECDGKDNDCDGAIDEDCATACVRVTQNGDDATGGAQMRPFKSLQAAIAWSSAVATRPKAICIAGGATCDVPSTFITSEGNAFNMASGVSVYGNYESTTWTRCPLVNASGVPTLNVTIQPRTYQGVIFPATVTAPTTLDGVRVARFANTNMPSAGITVAGAKQVVISNIVIDDVPAVTATYGVHLTNGAEALITRSSIMGGAVSGESIAVRSVGSKPVIRDNCATIDPATGRCTAACSSGITALGLRGRAAPSILGNAMAVDLINSPGAVVERNTMCGTQGSQGFGVHIAGVATGTIIRGNVINALGGTARSHGVWMDGCAQAAPWIVGNDILADGTGTGTKISAVGAEGPCHPVIDGNVRIAGAGEANQTTSVGVSCGAAAGVASRCAIVGNKLIQGGAAAHAALAMAIECEAGGCGRIAGNKIVGQGGATVVGLSIVASGPLVERNDIQGGCGTKVSTGLLAEDAWARVENNVVRGGTCTLAPLSPEVHGVHVHAGVGGHETDVHSNTIDAGGLGACMGAAAGIGVGDVPGPKVARGIFRNNVLRAGACTIARSNFLEDSAEHPPRVFEHNDLDPTGLPTALYVRNATQNLTAIAAVNALPGASGNLSVDPMFVSSADLHLGPASMCANAGTKTGAPATDLDGKARADGKPDIGAYER